MARVLRATKKMARWVRAMESGAGEESRTPDLRITNALLYQLSYTGGQPASLAERPVLTWAQAASAW
jgi:hypothetical protein